MIFLTYEEMKADLPKVKFVCQYYEVFKFVCQYYEVFTSDLPFLQVIKRVADFLDKGITAEEVVKFDLFDDFVRWGEQKISLYHLQ